MLIAALRVRFDDQCPTSDQTPLRDHNSLSGLLQVSNLVRGLGWKCVRRVIFNMWPPMMYPSSLIIFTKGDSIGSGIIGALRAKLDL